MWSDPHQDKLLIEKINNENDNFVSIIIIIIIIIIKEFIIVAVYHLQL